MPFLARIFNSPVLMSWLNLGLKSSAHLFILPFVLVLDNQKDVVFWFTLSTIFGIQMLLDAGLVATLSRYVSYVIGGLSITDIIKGRLEASQFKPADLSMLFFNMRTVYLIVSIIAFFLLLIVSYFFLVPIALNTSDPEAAVTTLYCILIIGAVNLYSNTYISFLQGVEEVAYTQRVQSICSVVSILVAISSLVLIESIFFAAIGFYLPYLIALPVLKAKTYGLNLIELNNALMRRDLLKKLLSDTWKTGVGVFSTQGIFQFSGLFVARLTSSDVSSSYMLALQFIRAAAGFSQAPFYSKLPSMNAGYVLTEKRASIASLINTRIFLSLVVFASLSFLIYLIGPLFLNLINSETSFPDLLLWGLLSSAFFFERLSAMYLQVYTISGDVIWHKVSFFGGGGIVVIASLLWPFVDIYSLPLGMFLVYLLYVLPVVFFKSRSLFEGEIYVGRNLFLFFIFLTLTITVNSLVDV